MPRSSTPEKDAPIKAEFVLDRKGKPKQLHTQLCSHPENPVWRTATEEELATLPVCKSCAKIVERGGKPEKKARKPIARKDAAPKVEQPAAEVVEEVAS